MIMADYTNYTIIDQQFDIDGSITVEENAKRCAHELSASVGTHMAIGSLGALIAGALWETGHWVPFVASAFINATGVLFLLKLRTKE